MAKKKLIKIPEDDLQGLTLEQFKSWELEECNLEVFKKANGIK